MKKLLSLTLCAALLLTLPACAAQPKEPENPYRCTSILYEFMDESENVNSTQIFENTYNEAGLLVKQTTITDGILTSEASHEYDEYGNPLKIIVISEEDTKITEYHSTLDEAHRPLRTECYRDDKLISAEEFTYDKNGNITFNLLTSWEIEDTPDVFKNEYTYDRNGNLTERIWTYDGSVYRWTYTDGKPTNRLHTSESGETQDYIVYEYDDQGREVKWIEHDPNGEPLRTGVTVYDADGLTATSQTWHGTEISSDHRNVYTYDEYGNTLSLLKQQKNGEQWQTYWRITYSYEPIPTT